MADYSIYDWSVKILGSTYTVEGLSDDNDCVSFPQDREETKFRVGATGDVVFFGSPLQRGGLFMIKLVPDSPTVKVIALQIARSRTTKAATGAYVNWDASAYNRRTKLRVTMTNGRVTKAPVSPNSGPEPANLTFEWMYQDIEPDWSNVVSAV